MVKSSAHFQIRTWQDLGAFNRLLQKSSKGNAMYWNQYTYHHLRSTEPIAINYYFLLNVLTIRNHQLTSTGMSIGSSMGGLGLQQGQQEQQAWSDMKHFWKILSSKEESYSHILALSNDIRYMARLKVRLAWDLWEWKDY